MFYIDACTGKSKGSVPESRNTKEKGLLNVGPFQMIKV
jgi:hypothetical protein